MFFIYSSRQDVSLVHYNLHRTSMLFYIPKKNKTLKAFKVLFKTKEKKYSGCIYLMKYTKYLLQGLTRKKYLGLFFRTKYFSNTKTFFLWDIKHHPSKLSGFFLNNWNCKGISEICKHRCFLGCHGNFFLDYSFKIWSVKNALRMGL